MSLFCSLFLLATVGNVLRGTYAHETAQDAAVFARALIDSPTAIGTMATVYPSNHSLAGQPFALQEYYARCFANGSLALIFMPISRHSQNIIHSPTHAASITVWSDPPGASRARVSFTGTVDILYAGVDDHIRECYVNKHPDAKWWLPERENGPHMAFWARFDPHSIYYVGGFGSEHYIGPVPLELYQRATATASGSFSALAGRLKVQREG